MMYEQLGREIGRLVDEKQTQYGDSFNRAGMIIKILYPDGIEPEQYDDMLSLVRIIDKLFRVANGNQGEENAYRDIAGYGLLGARRDDEDRHTMGDRTDDRKALHDMREADETRTG